MGNARVATTEPAPDRRDDFYQPWSEWRQQCAAALCSHPARHTLHAWAYARFSRLLERCAARTKRTAPPAHSVSPRDAWHLFETYLTVPGSAGGKSYKKWLFSRTARSSDHPLDVVQSGASLIMRDVTRRYLRQEQHSWCMDSLDRPLTGDGATAPTGRELLACVADPADEAARREFERLAGDHAARLIEGIDKVDRVVLLARHCGRPLSDPEIERLAGRRKSALGRRYRAMVNAVVGELRALYPDDDGQGHLLLGAMTVENLQERVFLQEKVEMRFGQAFYVAEER
jgi:hypothetical protein